jgi:hypothetical protein
MPATAALHPQPAPSSASGTINTRSHHQQHQAPFQQTLRRAVYVHVSDLTSAYNIDHSRLEEELARVNPWSSTTATGNAPSGGGHAAKIVISSNVAINTRFMTPSDLDSGGLPQKRLQPPRGGFNLCV